MTTLPETNIPSENWWLEVGRRSFPFGKAHVVGGYHPHGHQLGEGTPHCLTHRILGKSPDPRGRSRSPLGHPRETSRRRVYLFYWWDGCSSTVGRKYLQCRT